MPKKKDEIKLDEFDFDPTELLEKKVAEKQLVMPQLEDDTKLIPMEEDVGIEPTFNEEVTTTSDESMNIAEGKKLQESIKLAEKIGKNEEQIKNAAKATQTKLDKKQIKKIKKNFEKPDLVLDAIKRDALAASENKEPTLTDKFTSALVHFSPQLIGLALGGMIEGGEGAVAGMQGATAMQDRQIAQKQAAEKAKIEERKLGLKQQELDIDKAYKEGKLKEATLKALKKEAKAQQKSEQEIAERSFGYKDEIYTAINDDDAKILKRKAEAYGKIKDLIKGLRELRKEHGGETLNRGAVAKEKVLRTNLQMTLKGEDFYKLGVLAGPDMDLIDSATMDDYLSHTTLDNTVFTKLKALEDYADDEWKGTVSTRTTQGTRTAHKIKTLKGKFSKEQIEAELNRRRK